MTWDIYLYTILFHVRSQAYSRLYWREHVHVARQLLTCYQTVSIKQESSEEKPSINLGKKDKYFIFSLSKVIEDSVMPSIILANDFREAEDSQTRRKEPTPKNVQA